MIVGGQTEARAQLSSTIIDYHEPFDQGFRVRVQKGIAWHIDASSARGMNSYQQWEIVAKL